MMMLTQKQIALYIPLLLLLFAVFTFLWSGLAMGKLYYCSDSVPLLDFMPPFVHGVSSDYYIMPEPVVYGVWLASLVMVVLLPVWLSRKLVTNKKEFKFRFILLWLVAVGLYGSILPGLWNDIF